MGRKFVILLALGVVTLALPACSNTFHGAGEDMESWGRTLQDNF